MTQAKALLGVWKPETMAAPGSQVYDILAFQCDGTGFLDFSSPETKYFCEYFRWSLDSPGELRLRGERIQRLNTFDPVNVEQPSTLDAIVSFSIRTEQTNVGRQTQVLRMGTCPWSALANPLCVATERYQVHEPTYATFQAPCFVRKSEAGDTVFRGKALSAYLAKQLKARHLPVGPMVRVFMGACYYREVEVGGQFLGLSVNWDWDLQAWWLQISPPSIGGKAEAEELGNMVQQILEGVDDLHDLKWHTVEWWTQPVDQSDSKPKGDR
jgi:hypothetical protein